MATAYANTNIALVKYWGKRSGLDPSLNLPEVGSFSLTLDRFGTETTVERVDEGGTAGDAGDTFVLDGVPAPEGERARVSRFLDLVRALSGSRASARVTSRNDVPTAAGLASSASGFAALAVAACAAFDVALDPRARTQLARRGSGSAARSLYGGLVLLRRGVRDDGADCFAEPVASPLVARDAIRLVVVRTSAARKATGSTDGMARTAETSPFYGAWTQTHPDDLDDAVAAATSGDLEGLGRVMEHNTLKMHASALAARPAVLYWNGTTLEVFRTVTQLREKGTGAWATMDAGPHVKVLCATSDADAVASVLRDVPGVEGVDLCAPGADARRIEGPRA